MLSTSPIKSSNKASNYYFCPDEYYFQDSIEQSWVGKGAEILGLEGEVDVEQFKSLLDGKLPNGQQLGRMQNGQLKHRPGFDLTFNAPKSLSLLAIIGKDDRLLKVHSLAVKAALNSIEQRCAQARVTKNGVTQFQTTNNLTVATFRHELSRAGDPHLHTHCIVMNATACEDGKWRSLASNRDFNTQDRYGFWEQVIHHQRYYGLIYRAELAYQLTQLGYQIRKTGDHHFFEIAGVPQAAIETFSQRRKAIEAYMAKKGQSSAKDAAFATLATRQAKKARDKEQLNQLWQERANYHGFNPEQVIGQAKSGGEIEKEVAIPDELKQIVINAIDQLTQKASVFSEQKIIQQVFNNQPEQMIRVSDLLSVIATLSKENFIITITDDKSRYTTQQLIDQEQTLIKHIQDSKDVLQAILPELHLKKWLERTPDCNAFEEKALLRIFATGHQFQGIMGSNPDAQERLIHRIKHLSTLAKIQPIFLSQSQNRAQQLKQQYELTSFNLYRWLQNMNKTDNNQQFRSKLSQKIWMIDEAQYLSLSQFSELMHISQRTKARIIFFCDPNHLSSFSHTNMLQSLHLPKIYLPKWKMSDEKSPHLDNMAHEQQNPLDIRERVATHQPQNEQSSFQKVLRYAISHLSEREAVFDEDTLKTMMLEQMIGTMSPEKLDQLWVNELLPDAKKQGLLFACKQDGKTLLTTPQSLKLEQGIISLAKQGAGQYKSLASEQSIQKFLQGSILNHEQRQAIELMMTHDHQFMLIQGIAGSGKTTAMSVAQSFLNQQNQGYRLLGLAPTHRAVGVLKERDINARTLQSYLKEHQQSQKNDTPQGNRKTILLLDEASMVSNRQMHQFLQVCYDTKARAVIMGDIQQLPAIEAGKPFALLQKQNIPMAELKQTERYVEGSPLKSAVTALHQSDVPQAFQALQQEFYEEKSKLESLTILAKQYVAAPPSERSKLQVITPSHHDRILFNNVVRMGLKQQGELGEKEITVNILMNRNMTQAEHTDINQYRIGDVLKFHKSHGLPVAKGSYLKVAELVDRNNALVLIDQKEQRFYWQLPTVNPKQNIGVEVYRPEQRELRIGDQIRWIGSNAYQRSTHFDSAVITNIGSEYAVQVKQADGTSITLDLSNPEHLHIDHAYAGTAHALQGITVEKVSLTLRSDQRNLANQKTFIVAISRSTQNIGIHTDNQARLLEKLSQNHGDKTSSIEMMSMLGKDKFHEDANSSKQMTELFNKYNYSAFIQDKLNQSLPNLLKYLMAEEPRRKTQLHYYYGHNKGSLAVAITGGKQGLWYDFQTGQGGNILQLVQLTLGVDFKQALDYVVQHLSLTQKNIKSPKTNSARTIFPVISKRKGSFNQNEVARIHYAQTLYDQSKIITGTLAERYLRTYRGIQGELPDSLRYHPHVYSKINNIVAPALLAIAKNQHDQVRAVQAIFLNPSTAKKATLPIQKQTFGMLKGASVKLQTKTDLSSDFILYAEGPETGLSILEAFPRAQVEVLLGSSQFKHIPHHQTANYIVLCLDNDRGNAAVPKLYHDVANTLTQAGKQVWLAKPAISGYDFNDVLLKQGRDSVYLNIINSKLYAPIESGITLHQFAKEVKGLSGKWNSCFVVSENNPQSPILQSETYLNNQCTERLESKVFQNSTWQASASSRSLNQNKEDTTKNMKQEFNFEHER